MYTSINFKTKKAFKEAVKKWNDYVALKNEVKPMTVGAVLVHKAVQFRPDPIRVFQPGPFNKGFINSGVEVIEGPQYPEPHRWYAQAKVVDGVVVSVK